MSTVTIIASDKTVFSGDIHTDHIPDLISYAKNLADADSPVNVTERVCSYLKESTEAVRSRSRNTEFIRTRAIISYRLVRHHKYSTVKVGHLFKLDHATIIHAIRVCEKKYMGSYNAIFKNGVEESSNG